MEDSLPSGVSEQVRHFPTPSVPKRNSAGLGASEAPTAKRTRRSTPEPQQRLNTQPLAAAAAQVAAAPRAALPLPQPGQLPQAANVGRRQNAQGAEPNRPQAQQPNRSPERAGGGQGEGEQVLPPVEDDKDSLFDEDELSEVRAEDYESEGDRDAPEKLTNLELLQRRLSRIERLYRLYKVEQWGVLEQLRTRHRQYLIKEKQASLDAAQAPAASQNPNPPAAPVANPAAPPPPQPRPAPHSTAAAPPAQPSAAATSPASTVAGQRQGEGTVPSLPPRQPTSAAPLGLGQSSLLPAANMPPPRAVPAPSSRDAASGEAGPLQPLRALWQQMRARRRLLASRAAAAARAAKLSPPAVGGSLLPGSSAAAAGINPTVAAQGPSAGLAGTNPTAAGGRLQAVSAVGPAAGGSSAAGSTPQAASSAPTAAGGVRQPDSAGPAGTNAALARGAGFQAGPSAGGAGSGVRRKHLPGAVAAVPRLGTAVRGQGGAPGPSVSEARPRERKTWGQPPAAPGAAAARWSQGLSSGVLRRPRHGDSIRGYGDDEGWVDFFDVEELILGCTETTPVVEKPQLLAWRQAFQQRLPEIVRLEHSGSAAAVREMDMRRAIAVLCGRCNRFFIRRTAILLGRTTASSGQVDIDLKAEGDARKVSRKQAQLTLEPGGTFRLRNVGRRSMRVDEQVLNQGQAAELRHLSLIEVGGVRLLLMVNFAAVKRVLTRSARLCMNNPDRRPAGKNAAAAGPAAIGGVPPGGLGGGSGSAAKTGGPAPPGSMPPPPPLAPNPRANLHAQAAAAAAAARNPFGGGPAGTAMGGNLPGASAGFGGTVFPANAPSGGGLPAGSAGIEQPAARSAVLTSAATGAAPRPLPMGPPPAVSSAGMAAAVQGKNAPVS